MGNIFSYVFRRISGGGGGGEEHSSNLRLPVGDLLEYYMQTQQGHGEVILFKCRKCPGEYIFATQHCKPLNIIQEDHLLLEKIALYRACDKCGTHYALWPWKRTMAMLPVIVV